ncbi:hypothetical protein AGMMS49975_19700 [Clostridia bacterium]|nr:hypothetical protein AGMMS49975_19700 [Clostridia bacterium]
MISEQNNDKVEMLTIDEAAALIHGLSKYRVRAMCVNNEIPHVRAGRKYPICKQVLIRWLTEPTSSFQSHAGSEGKIQRINV